VRGQTWSNLDAASCLAEQHVEHVVSLQLAATTSGKMRLPLMSGLADTTVFASVQSTSPELNPIPEPVQPAQLSFAPCVFDVLEMITNTGRRKL